MNNEAFSRVKIDAQLRDQQWEIENPNAVRYESVLPDKSKADYVLCDRDGRSLAILEAKKCSINPPDPARRAKNDMQSCDLRRTKRNTCSLQLVCCVGNRIAEFEGNVASRKFVQISIPDAASMGLE